jgi:hypothetical protein
MASRTIGTTVKLNEGAINRFLEGDQGPVVTDLRRRAENVTALATLRASGPVIGIRSGRLHSGIQYRIDRAATGPQAVVFTDAMSSWRGQPFSYPAFHDVAGVGEPQGGQRPWLSQALRAALD